MHTYIISAVHMCSTTDSMVHGDLSGKKSEKEGEIYIYIYMADSFYCTIKTNTTL